MMQSSAQACLTTRCKHVRQAVTVAHVGIVSARHRSTQTVDGDLQPPQTPLVISLRRSLRRSDDETEASKAEAASRRLMPPLNRCREL